MLTEQEKVMRCVCFDSFCKTILRNAIRNFYKQLSRLERREWLSDDPAFYQKAEAATADDHPSDHLHVVYRGRRYILDNKADSALWGEAEQRNERGFAFTRKRAI